MSAADKQARNRPGSAPRPAGVMRVPALTLVFLLLVLAANVATAFLDFGGLQFVVNLLLAGASVIVIALFFMGLRNEPSLNRLAASAGFLWLVLFFMLIFGDYFTRVVHPF